jgi:hypothetical protein
VPPIEFTEIDQQPKEQTEVSLDQLHAAIQPLRQALLAHPIYDDLGRPHALRTFMEHHIFAVWDFMSLLKVMQQRLCCVSVPWTPNADTTAGRFINEIVMAEETDDDGHGGYVSHFELYCRAMTTFGADTSRIDRFLDVLRNGETVRQAMKSVGLPEPIQQFVSHTFSEIEGGDTCRIVAAFTFGREDLLPDVFQKIVNELDEQSGGGLDDFKYYLLRHVDLDSGAHGPMTARLIASLCRSDESKWRVAENAAVSALQSRLLLWDGIVAAIEQEGMK